MELRRKIFLLMLACVCCLNDSHAQHAVSDLSLRRDTSAIIRLYFRFDRSLLEKKYLTNEESLAKLDTMLNRPEVRDNLDSIVIIASASPEGMLERNIKLAEERARATRTLCVLEASRHRAREGADIFYRRRLGGPGPTDCR